MQKKEAVLSTTQKQARGFEKRLGRFVGGTYKHPKKSYCSEDKQEQNKQLLNIKLDWWIHCLEGRMVWREGIIKSKKNPFFDLKSFIGDVCSLDTQSLYPLHFAG
ncbi:MAG: hypothetical protein GY821_16515 [Gammaproteobacteria bacterium]|nr:hypothetical protein [Gammaproteobacteria bacterium]